LRLSVTLLESAKLFEKAPNANGTAVNGAGHPAPEVDDQTRREAVDELLKSLGRSKDQPKT